MLESDAVSERVAGFKERILLQYYFKNTAMDKGDILKTLYSSFVGIYVQLFVKTMKIIIIVTMVMMMMTMMRR